MASAVSIAAQMPNRSEGNPDSADAIAAVMQKVNAWQEANPVRGKLDNSWIRGTWYTGVMAAYGATGDEAYLRQAMRWAESHQWQPGTELAGGNVLTCAQTYLELFFLKKDRSYLEPTIRWLDSGAANTPSGARVWYLEGGLRYADSLYVGAPPLAMLAKATGDRKYLDWLHAFFWDVQQELFDEAAGLFYRDRRYRGQRTVNGRKVLWSRGNGWAFASLPRVLAYLPKNEPGRERFVALFRQMAASLRSRQQPDGLWRPNLDDAEEFYMPETSGTGFFCYGLAWGIRHGLLDRATYLPAVEKAWSGLVSYLSPEGKVQWGQLVGAAPTTVEEKHTHEYVTGTFLLAGSEVYQLAKAGMFRKKEDGRGAAGGVALLPPVAVAKGPLAVAAHPLAGRIETFRERQALVRDFNPTGQTRVDYLRIIEGQVRAMRQYQAEDGRLIDPVEKVEKYFATPCYAHSVAVLAASGHIKDQSLLESGMKALESALADMAAAKAAGGHGDFFTWPAMFAYELLRKTAPRERSEGWAGQLQAVDPKKLYRAFLHRAGNWGIVNLAGEYFRHRAGFTTLDYIEESLRWQRANFTPLGQFNENGNPLPYDHFPRHYLAGVLQLGYRGAYFESYREWLWRGAWTSLFLQSPTGEMPTGYRSSQHIWNEAEQCVTFELFAQAYAQAGRRAEAGAFKRAARLSLESIKQWIRPDGSGCVVKNHFPIEARHGYEGYSAHTCYNLLACSMLAQAWQFADDAIEERPAPADLGGFVVPILTPFHKVVANAGGTYVEYDTNGDHVYNPTGLIRLHLKGGHPQLGPSDGCAPRYSGKGVNVAVGPAWKDAAGAWHSLAEWSAPKVPGEGRVAGPKLDILEESLTRVIFQVVFDLTPAGRPAGEVELLETIRVEPSGVTVTDEFRGKIDGLRVTWPMLVHDGREAARINAGGSSVSAMLGGRGVQFTVLKPERIQLERDGAVLDHRNGRVEIVTARIPGRRAVYRLTPITAP